MVPLTEKHYRLALALVPGIGCAWLRKLLAYFGSSQAVFAAAHKGNTLLPYKIAQSITASSSLSQAEKILQLYETEGIQLLTTEEETLSQTVARATRSSFPALL